MRTRATRSVEQGPEPRAAAHRILLVDDDRAMRQLLAEILAEERYDVIQASDGTEAVRILREDPVGIDLVVMDHRMPRTTGLEAVAQIRSYNACTPGWTPVILVTAFADHAITEEATRLGVACVFPKPFPLDGLLREVRRLTTFR